MGLGCVLEDMMDVNMICEWDSGRDGVLRIWRGWQTCESLKLVNKFGHKFTSS